MRGSGLKNRRRRCTYHGARNACTTASYRAGSDCHDAACPAAGNSTSRTRLGSRLVSSRLSAMGTTASAVPRLPHRRYRDLTFRPPRHRARAVYTPYSLLRTTEHLLGASAMGGARRARGMWRAFNLVSTPPTRFTLSPRLGDPSPLLTRCPCIVVALPIGTLGRTPSTATARG